MTNPTVSEALKGMNRAHDVDEIAAHLGAAISQSLPTDDQIIMGHVRDAYVLAQSLQRQLRAKRGAV